VCGEEEREKERGFETRERERDGRTKAKEGGGGRKAVEDGNKVGENTRRDDIRRDGGRS
jgi:hypothetical protein